MGPCQGETCACVLTRASACDVCMYPSICSNFSSILDVCRCTLVIMCCYVRVCAPRGICTGTRAAPASCWQAAPAFLLSQAYHCVTTLQVLVPVYLLSSNQASYVPIILTFRPNTWFLSRRRGSAHGATHAAGNRPPRSPHVMCVHCRDLTPRALQRPRLLHRLRLLHKRRGAAAGGPQLRKRCPPSARPPPEADLGPTHSGHVDSHKRAGLVVTMQPVTPGPL